MEKREKSMSRFAPVKDAVGRPKKVSLFAWYGVRMLCRKIWTAECLVVECISATGKDVETDWSKIKKC